MAVEEGSLNLQRVKEEERDRCSTSTLPSPPDLCDRLSTDEQREFLQESTSGFLTNRNPGGEVHRHWPDELKAQIVSEGLRPGAMVNEVAERQGLNPNYILTWRTMARQGKLVLPAPEDAVVFASVIGVPPASDLPI
jgi:transposase